MTPLTAHKNIRYTGGLTAAMQVADRTKAAEWFSSVLGFSMLYDVPEIGWCELSTSVPGVNLGLSEVDQPKVGAGPVLTWGVSDIAQARSQLEKADVRFDGPTREYPGMVKLATFFDPDGNTFMLYESLSGEG